MTLKDLLADLQALNVQLYVEEGNLRCKAPVNTLTDALKAQLKSRKQELVELLGQAENSGGQINPIPRTAPLPLSYAQQRLWFLDQLEPDSAFYNIPIALHLQGQLNSLALAQSVAEIIRRHESLRTTFVNVNGEGRQVIADSLHVPLKHIDLSGLPKPIRQALAQQLCRQEASTPFDLAGGPLIRTQLLKLREEEDGQEAIFLVTLHHIIADGWSAGVLTREFSSLYQAFSAGGQSPLAELRIHYADYAYWQRQWLSGAVLQKQIDYWQQTLAGAPALLTLPTDYPRPQQMRHHGASHSFNIPPLLSEQIQTLGKQHRTTLFVVLLTAFSALLSRYSQQTDICIGTPVANRQHSGTEGLIGFFVNTLVLRADLAADPSFISLLLQMHQTVLAAQSHQDLPFEQLVTLLQPERSASHSPLFQVLLSVENYTAPALLALSSLRIGGLENTGGNAKFDLSLHIRQTAEGGLACQFEYNTDLFAATTIARWSQHFVNLLSGIAEQADAPLSGLPILTEAETQQLQIDRNSYIAAGHGQVCIHRLFEFQAGQTPDSIALVYESQQLSYGQLNRQANHLAYYLLAIGVCPDDRVAICVQRGLDMVIGLLGILKAGAAYVPLDLHYPEERLAYLLKDSAPKALLTQIKLLTQLSVLASPEMTVVCLDELSASPAGQGNAISDINFAGFPDTNPAIVALHPEHLAYIIYTSGSTGQPKGVMVSHANVTRLFAVTQAQFQFSADDVWTLFHSFAFDFSVWEIWGALLYGGRLVIVPHGTARNPDAFYQLLCDQHVTVLNQTPGAFRQLITAQAQNPLPHHLRMVIFGGEALDFRSLAPWLARNSLADTQLVNMYGITEITVHATYKKLSETDIRFGIGSNIGKPLADLKFYLLDAHQQPVPLGVTGEIYIAGAGVAKAYLNRAELTAERFPDNPFPHDGNPCFSRLYKTGDLGRWLPDGSLEYLGRNDFQVKIRGYRIELGEIEAQLCLCHGIREAIVIAREDAAGNQRLVAYCIPETGHEVDASDLRGQLAGRLADYMLPSAYVMLSAFPLTAHGKLDRQALPEPDSNAVSSRLYQAPQTQAEKTLATIWQALLHLEQVGRYDHFFELGGHSLLIVTLIDRMRQQGLVATVRTVFANPTLMDLAAASEGVDNNAEGHFTILPNLLTEACTAIHPEHLPLVSLSQAEIDRIVACVPGGVGNIQDIYPLAPLQEGILFHHLLATQGDAYLVRSLLSFSDRPRLDAFLKALQIVIDRHDILRTAVHWDGLAQPVQVVQRHALLPVIELALHGDHIRAQLLEHSDPGQLRLDISRAPLFAAFIAFDPHGNEWLLALVNHHLIDDNYTLQLILAEIQLILQGRSDQLPPVLPYRNFIAQMHHMTVAEHEAYFRGQLGDISEPTVPFGITDIQGDGQQTSQAGLLLDAELSQRIYDNAQQYGVSPAVLFHLVWGQVLAQCCGQGEVVFGTVLSGRLQGATGVGQVLGLFINTLPIRISLTEHSVQQAVADTYLRLSGLLDHEHATLALAQRCSSVAAGLPLFTTLLNYRHAQLLEGADADDPNAFNWDGIHVLGKEEWTNYPLSVDVDDLGSAFSLQAQCVAGISPERIVGYVKTAIAGLVDALEKSPDVAIRVLDILSEPEKNQLLVEFNHTAKPYPDSLLVHQLFEQQVQKTPDAVAVVYEKQSLTYQSLNQKANQLAHYLHGNGVKPDSVVGICVGRSVLMVVCALAVLKAGGAYLPLDPELPEERLQLMMEDSHLVVLLTDKPVSNVDQAIMINVLEQSQAINAQARDNPVNRATTSNLAYVIYTSGSTNRPKGVMVSHGNLTNAYFAWQDAYQLGTKPRTHLQMANFSFDVCTGDMVRALLSGDKLVICPRPLLLDAQELYGLICQEQVNAAEFVPIVLRNLMQYLEKAGKTLAGMDLLICGSDTWTVTEYQHYQRYCASTTRLINSYGLTEATIDSTYYENTGTALNIELLPIGRPFANTRIYILDKFLKNVPIGAVGELYLAGGGLARGYLRQSRLTAEKFIPDLFSTKPGGRLYKTGDIARYLPNGAIEFLGRNDFQIKIRGFRIELGEIEAQLSRCPGVRAAVVVASADSAGNQRLVAYLTAESGHGLSPSELRGQLALQLPDYILPAAFVVLNEFPLNSNGKLDRKALPAPDDSTVINRRYQAAQGQTEILIAKLWQELLQLGQVGRQDHFFELGGHSLLAVQFISRLQQALGVEVALRTLFAQPILHEFAAALGNPSANRNLVPIRTSGSLRPIFLVHPAGGEVNYVRDMVHWLDENLPVYGLAARGFMSDESPLSTIEEMAALYLQAIRSVQTEGPYRLAGWSVGGTIAYEMANQLIGADQTVEFVGLLDTGFGYDADTPESEIDILLGMIPDDALTNVFTELNRLATAADLNAMLDYALSSGLLSADIDKATALRVLAVHKAIANAAKTYALKPIPAKLTLFAAQGNRFVEENCAGWQALAGGRLQVIPVEGDHMSITQLPNVQHLGIAINKALTHCEDPVTFPEQRYAPAILLQMGNAAIKPLFCVPGAGAGITSFYALSHALDPRLPIYGMQPRGLDGELVPHIDVASAALAYIKALRDISPHGPYRLLGHSFGGWVVFEMALQLTAQGEQIEMLVALDTDAPFMPNQQKQRHTQIGMLMELVKLFELAIDGTLGLAAEDFVGLSRDQQLSRLLCRLIDVKLLPPRTRIKTLQGIVRVFETNVNTCYTPEKEYAGPLHLVTVTDAKNASEENDREDYLRSWRRFAPMATVLESAGNHISLLSAPHVGKLAEVMNALLVGKR